MLRLSRWRIDGRRPALLLILGDEPNDESTPPDWGEMLATAFWRGVTWGVVATVTLLLLALGFWTVS